MIVKVTDFKTWLAETQKRIHKEMLEKKKAAKNTSTASEETDSDK